LARKNSGAVYNVRVLRQLPRPPQSVRNVRLVATDNPTAQSPPTTGPSRRDSGDPHNERSNGTDGGHGPNSARTSNQIPGFLGLLLTATRPPGIKEVNLRSICSHCL
jgi:hypothetical protein